MVYTRHLARCASFVFVALSNDLEKEARSYQ
jgi:hypothetical protein